MYIGHNIPNILCEILFGNEELQVWDLHLFHVFALIFLFFITFQLVHQLTSPAKTLYFYTVKCFNI